MDSHYIPPKSMYDKQELFFALLEIRNGEKNESEK